MSVIRRHRTDPTEAETEARVSSRRCGRWRRVARGFLVVAAGTAALALAGPFALRPFADVAHAAGTAGETSVAFVLDFGGSATDQVVGCVTVPSSDDRYDALAAFVAQEHLAQPTYASSGLLCSINGIPSSGCGTEVAGGYIYWAYWTGGSRGWTYAETGAQNPVGQNDVEGWRFENPGRANPSDPPPRTAPHYDAICGPHGTTPGGGGSKAGGDGGGGNPSTGTAGSPAGGAGAVAGGAGQHPHAKKGTVTTTSAPEGSTSPSAPGAASSTTTSSTDASATTTVPSSVPLEDAAGHAGGTGGSSPVPLIVGGLLVAGLAIAAYVRSRRNPRTR